MNQNDPRPGLTSVSYTCAYWDFLRGRRPDAPDPLLHGVTVSAAVVIRAMCDTEFSAIERRSS